MEKRAEKDLRSTHTFICVLLLSILQLNLSVTCQANIFGWSLVCDAKQNDVNQ